MKHPECSVFSSVCIPYLNSLKLNKMKYSLTTEMLPSIWRLSDSWKVVNIRTSSMQIQSLSHP